MLSEKIAKIYRTEFSFKCILLSKPNFMGYDVALFKINPIQLISKVSNKENFVVPFIAYVEHKNITHPGRNYYEVNPFEIIQKIKTNINLLKEDEFWEIILWINDSTAETPDWGLQLEDVKIKSKLNEFGFYLIEHFQDNTKVFSFALGDFRLGFYNDFEDLNRENACLTVDEFCLFLDYVSYLYATVLLSVDEETYSVENNYFLEISRECSQNPLLRTLIEHKSKDIISTKSVKSDSMIFDIHSCREIYSGDFYQAIYRCQTIKKQLKENLYPIIKLDC